MTTGSTTATPNPVIVGITGASGSVLGLRLIERLLKSGQAVHAILSDPGAETLKHELKLKGQVRSIRKVLAARNPGLSLAGLKEYSNHDFFSPAASGTSRFRALIVAPCSMKTLSAIAHGYSENLIARAADVALKEKRPCILVPRETPLSLVHCRNLCLAKEAGADIVLPVPGYYAFPKTIDDVTDYVVGRILNLLAIPNTLIKPWGTQGRKNT